MADQGYTARQIDEQTAGLLGVVVVLRMALIVWATIVVVVDVVGVTSIHGVRAIVLLVALTLWTSAFAWLLRNRSTVLASPPFGIADVVVSAIAAAADPIVYPGPHPQSFSSAWPLSGAVVAGIVRGPRTGAAAGFVIGAAGAASVATVADGGMSGRVLGSMGTIVLLTVSGFLAGMLSNRIREIELTRARAQMREETARRLHDGVLQTLAVIQRRSSDAELVQLARDQESDLRTFIAAPTNTDPGVGATALSEALRTALANQERRFGLRTELVVVDEPSTIPAEVSDAITGAVSEAITNASKHGEASLVRVFLDSEDDVVRCEIRDDGTGFDTEHTTAGTGITRSIRGRMDEIGGSVDISSRPGDGVTVTMTVPLASAGHRRGIGHRQTPATHGPKHADEGESTDER